MGCSNITDFSHIFEQTNFNSDISNWDVSSGTDFSYIFRSLHLIKILVVGMLMELFSCCLFMLWNSILIECWEMGRKQWNHFNSMFEIF